MIPSALLKNKFTIRRSSQVITDGEITKTLATISTGNMGRFESGRGGRNRDFVGAVKSASYQLFCNYIQDIKVGDVIIREDDDSQYDVTAIADQEIPGSKHHLEIGLELRSNQIG